MDTVNNILFTFYYNSQYFLKYRKYGNGEKDLGKISGVKCREKYLVEISGVKCLGGNVLGQISQGWKKLSETSRNRYNICDLVSNGRPTSSNNNGNSSVKNHFHFVL
ncbi:hypothetical protein C0J52_08740 [Blattella germanica]|nr:hypothetical protein C0J52_08740 [Blattella germanica]